MTRETVISNFNTHDQLDEADDEDGDGVAELIRAPIEGIFGLHLSPYNSWQDQLILMTGEGWSPMDP